MPGATKDRLIDAARRLFYERGYEATSVADVLAEAKVGSGSLYHFFDSKEALLRGVLEWYLGALWPYVIQPAFDATADPIERVFAILAGYREMLLASEFRHGCPIGNLSLEVGESQTTARALIAQNFRNWSAAVQQALDGAQDRFAAPVDTASLATFVLTTMEGAVMLARAYRSLEPYDAAVAHLRTYLTLLSGHRSVGQAG